MMGTKLLMSTAFHPQTDGASERAIRSVTQILRGVVKANQSDWVERLPMVEFAMNSTVSMTTGFAPFEINGTMPRMITEFRSQQTVPGIDTFVHTVCNNLMMAHDSIIESRVLQIYQANKQRRPEHQQEGAHS